MISYCLALKRTGCGPVEYLLDYCDTFDNVAKQKNNNSNKMKVDLTVDNGPCDTDLRSWCLGIAIYSLISIALNVLAGPSVLTFVALTIAIIGNVCLLFGCLRYHHLLVGVWLIYAAILAINFPFAVIGTIFHFGGYRESTGFQNVILALLVHIILFVILLFCARIVYSYYLQLKNRQSSPHSAAVV